MATNKTTKESGKKGSGGYLVKHLTLSTGSRIEGYHFFVKIFSTQEAATQYVADQRAMIEQHYPDYEIEERDDGGFRVEGDGGYPEWPFCEISVEWTALLMDQPEIFSTEMNG